MKRILTFLISVAILFSSVLYVGAAGSVSFALGSVEAENGRIVDVDVYADSSCGFSSAVFDFTYDETALEFKECESDEKTAIKYNPTRGVRVVYLCTENPSLSNKSIFKLKFKTLKEGRTEVGISASDCVDSGADILSVQKCSGCYVEVKGKDNGSDSLSESDSKKSGSKTSREKSEKETKSSKSSKTDNDSLDSEESSDDGIKSLDSVNISEEKGSMRWVIFVSIGVGIIILILTGIKIGTTVAAKKSKKPSDSEAKKPSDTEENE